MLRNKIGDSVAGIKSRSISLPSQSTIVVSDSKSPKRSLKKSPKRSSSAKTKKSNIGNSLVKLILETYLRKSGFDYKTEVKAITRIYDANECKLARNGPCLLSEGVYGAAFQIKSDLHNIIVKLPKSVDRPRGYGNDSDGFDDWEMKFNQLAYDAIQNQTGKLETFGENLIAEPLGFWRSPTLSARGFKQNNFVFVYNFEPSLSTYADLIRTTAVSKHDFKVIVFQVLLMLDTLQTEEPGFCHNDMHGYNMLVKLNDNNASFTDENIIMRSTPKEMKGKYVIKLLDFGMCSSQTHETKDAKRLWRQTRGCPMVDFLMFCNKSLMYASAYNAKTKVYQEWNQDFLTMLGRLFPPQAIKNGDGTGQWLDQKYLHLDTSEGFAWIKKEFPKDTSPLPKVLNDPFFS